MKFFDINLYTPVQQRIGVRPLEATFIEDFPEGRIKTELMFHNDDFSLVIFRAAAYRTPDDPTPTTGWAIEKQFVPKESKDYFSPNVSSWVENCETSAVGRALANMGYTGTKAQRPSREEMNKVNRVADAYETLETTEPALPIPISVPTAAAGTLEQEPLEQEPPKPAEAAEPPKPVPPVLTPERVPGSITEELLVALNDVLDAHPMHPNRFAMNSEWVLSQVSKERTKVGLPAASKLNELSLYETTRVIEIITKWMVKS